MRPTTKSSHTGPPLPSQHQDRTGNATVPPPVLSPPQTSAYKDLVNPLSSKVNLVLSTSYADAEFHDVLSLADDRQLTNSAPARRQLRLQLQKEVIESNGELVREFGDVAKQLRRVGATINAITEDFESMKSTLGVVHEQTSAVLEEAATLINQRQRIQDRSEILRKFQNHFILSQDEVNALTLPGEPVNSAFFDAVARAKSIQKDCEHLLGFEDQTLGLGLMEQLSRHLDLAFQKLYKWILREFQGANHENPQMSGSIRRGLRLLSEKPSLFQNCLGVFSEARQRVLSDSFYLALTGVSPSGAPDNSVKPIELAAHDPLRYVGDMLAWAHSATVGEKEFFQSLFTADGESSARDSGLGGSSESWTLPPQSDDDEGVMHSDPTEALKQLVDHSLSGVSQALQQRIAQAIQTNEEIIQAYKLSNLMGFYRSLFSDIVGSASHFLECLAQIEAEALRQFRSLMREYIAGLQGTFQQAPPGLKAPGFLQESLGQLSALMKTYDTSLHESSDRAAGFEPVLVEALDPFLAGCENVGRAMSPRARAIFLINCNLAVIETLKPFTFAGERIARLQGSMKQDMDLLRDHQLVFFLENSGLQKQLSAADELEEVNSENAKTLRSHREFQPEVLVEASASLDEFLPSALIDATENLESLQDSSLARRLTEEAAEIFCTKFEHMENLLLMNVDEDEHARSSLTRTSVEVRVLLS